MFKIGQRVWVITRDCFGVVDNLRKIDNEGSFHYTISFGDEKGNVFQETDLHETADDMLTVLGYKKIQENDALMAYEHEKMNDSRLMSSSILHFYRPYNAYYSSSAITPQLHLAIHQKLIELGWVE